MKQPHTIWFAEGVPSRGVLDIMGLWPGESRLLCFPDGDDVQAMVAEHNPDTIWVRLRYQIDAAVMDAAPRLRCIASPTTGLDHIDLSAAEQRGIAVLSLKEDVDFLRTIPATAEHTIGLILSLLRRIPQAVQDTKAGGWDRYGFMGTDLKGKSVLVVGAGRVGTQVAGILAAFGATPTLTDNLRLQELRDADVVTVHVPLDESTRGLFDAEAFAAMPDGAWFVNTSRGEVVDEDALLDALDSGHVAGAALDVVCDERGQRNQQLIRHPRVIVTPHIGGCTVESLSRAEQRMAHKLLTWLASQP